jgi:hypothetical protein
MAMTPIEFIDERGGPTAIAKATGYKAGSVHLWRHRNKIPRAAWPEIVEAFPDVTIGFLKELEASSGQSDGEAA